MPCCFVKRKEKEREGLGLFCFRASPCWGGCECRVGDCVSGARRGSEYVSVVMDVYM